MIGDTPHTANKSASGHTGSHPPPASGSNPSASLDLDAVLADIRQQFPMLRLARSGADSRYVAYMDNAATSLKPQVVIDAVVEYDAAISANIHRGVHRLGERATELFEQSREKIRDFIGARSTSEVILTSGTTLGINLVAMGWAKKNLKPGDEILLTTMEHHANLVPWHLLAKDTGIVLRYVPLKKDSETQAPVPELDLEALERLVTSKTKLAAFAMVSNAVGTIHPALDMIRIIKEKNSAAHILLDAAQAAPHFALDVVKLGCSALVFSGHKVLGPTGTGVLYLREDFRDAFEPCIGGGDMIREVTLAGTSFADFPARLEPGTPNISGFIGLGAALDFFKHVGFATIEALERRLAERLNSGLEQLSSAGLRVVGHKVPRLPLASFTMNGAHPHDVATLLDRYGVAVRAGHHCAQPLMHALQIPGTTRASSAFYNDLNDVDQLVKALQKTRELLS